MSAHTDPIEILTSDRSWELLGTQELGRLVTHVGETIDIFPVNYVVTAKASCSAQRPAASCSS